MLSFLFAISFKFSRTSKTVVINSFCCFLFLNYAEKGTVTSNVFNVLSKFKIFLKTTNIILERSLQK